MGRDMGFNMAFKLLISGTKSIGWFVMNVCIMFKYHAVATLGFAENTYAISETARNLTSYIIVLSSTLPRGTNIAINISTASDLATGQ